MMFCATDSSTDASSEATWPQRFCADEWVDLAIRRFAGEHWRSGGAKRKRDTSPAHNPDRVILTVMAPNFPLFRVTHTPTTHSDTQRRSDVRGGLLKGYSHHHRHPNRLFCGRCHESQSLLLLLCREFGTNHGQVFWSMRWGNDSSVARVG